MSDVPGGYAGDDVPEIDVRSPGERWADSGREGYDRFRQRLDGSHVDAAAVAWMAFVLGLVAVEVYSGLRLTDFGDGSDGWVKAQIVASSGGILLLFGAIIGLAMAALVDSRSSRTAISLAIAGGVWAVIASVVGIAVAFHDPSSASFLAPMRGAESKAVAAIGEVTFGGLGLVITLLGWQLRSVRAAEPPRAPEVADLT